MPIGRLTRKIQCQSSVGEHAAEQHADAAAAGQTKPNTPIALARSAGSVKRFMISDSATATTIAPPMPCMARATISGLRVARPQASEAPREQHDADQEQAPLAVEVAEPAAEQQEAAEGQQVGVDHPDQRRLGEAEVAADRRQGDVHDRRVEHDHQVAQAEDAEGEPAASGRSARQRVVEHLDPVPHRRRRAALQVLDAADVGRDDGLRRQRRRGGASLRSRSASRARAAAPSRCRPSRSTGAPRSAPRDVEAERAQVRLDAAAQLLAVLQRAGRVERERGAAAASRRRRVAALQRRRRGRAAVRRGRASARRCAPALSA